MNKQPQHYEPPKISESIYIPSAEGTDKWAMTWVHEVGDATVNGCFKVTDKMGKLRIVKRFKSKDKGLAKAWKAVS
jgi:5-methylthioribose kinase